MTFTALHRALGAEPGPLTDALLDAAVAAHVEEASDLDWKSELQPARGLSQTDFPKDVAAMANSGGGLIVYGVCEVQKAATKRVDIGDVDEGHERSLRAAAINAISPPVFGLTLHRLENDGKRAFVVEVPASVDGPHLIYRGEYFGAPVRNDADTVWMKERQIEAMYRARFDERRHATEALNTLTAEALANSNTSKRAWLIAVAHPRIPQMHTPIDRDHARTLFEKVERLAVTYAGNNGFHPLARVDRLNPRPGLRRWMAVDRAKDDSSEWGRAALSIHRDGSATLAAEVGGQRIGEDEYLQGTELESAMIECAVADFMALTRLTAAATDNDEYDIRVEITWSGEEPLTILSRGQFDLLYRGSSTPLRRYTPVETTINAREADDDFHQHVHDLVQDCVNQGGISNVRMIQPPSREDPT